MSAHLSPEQAAVLVRAAAQGDRVAWEALVDGYAGLVWATARGYRLSDGDTQDVTQTTWLRLVENIGRLTDPGRVGAWLATTVRRECLRVLRQSKRTSLIDQWDDVVDVDGAVDPDAGLIRLEETDAVRAALEQLSPSAQALLRLLMLDPPPSYAEVSAALGIPVGSIGPTRGRCLRKLEALLGERGISSAARGVSPA
jgi:RNA polymerase sigma factor (sigma-70 family)